MRLNRTLTTAAATLLLAWSAGTANAAAATRHCSGSFTGRSLKAVHITVTNMPAGVCGHLIIIAQYLEGEPIPPWKVHKRGSQVTLAYQRERIRFTLVHT